MNPILRKLEFFVKLIIPFQIKIFLRKRLWEFLYLKLRAKKILQGETLENSVFCPISETYFNTFVPLYKEYDPTLPSEIQPRISPDSGARDGLRLQWLLLKNKTDLFDKNNKLLHIGPEYCFYVQFKELNNLDYHPVDINNKKYSRDVKFGDVTELQYHPETFDSVICNHVLEHVTDDKKAMREIFRVLKPGGMAIITAPIDHDRNETYEDHAIIKLSDREKEFGQWDHYRYHGLDFPQRLESAGFRVSTEYYARTFSESDFEKYGLRDEPVFICRKPES